MNLLFRTDASLAIGTGHVMRCLALAQAWLETGGSAAFASAESTPTIQSRLAAESCGVFSITAQAGTAEDATQTIALARAQQADWVVVDGYQFDSGYQHSLKAAGLKLLFLDDYGHAHSYSADLVLNQNLGTDAATYQHRDPCTRLLLGPRYCLLRREFASWRDWKREIAPVCGRVLVMMGGSDPQELTVRVLEALAMGGFEEIEVTVVVGGSNPRLEELQGLAMRSDLKISVRQDVSNMAELMAAADVAVSAAGSTCWELCLLGLPALLVDVAANQTSLAKELDRRGCAVRIGGQTISARTIANQLKRISESYELRQSLSRRCRELVDGHGARRVAGVLRGIPELRMRPVRDEDRRLLWEWANDPEVRAASFSSDAITWETHVAWFAGKVTNGNSLLLVAEDEAKIPLGQIRFDFTKNGEVDLNVSLARQKRGCGLAAPVIQAGVRELFASTPCERVHAFVKPENVASARAFEKAGFLRVGSESVRGQAAIRFDLSRS